MGVNWAEALSQGEPNYRRIVLERAKVNARQILEDVPGLQIDADARYDHAFNAAVLEIRAHVLAGVVRGDPYTIEDRVTGYVPVPERPVLDGALSWLAAHTPWRVSDWFARRTRWREIETRRVVKKQQIDYYGCPHAAIRTDRDMVDVHLAWMGEKSGQLPTGSADTIRDAAERE